MKRKASAELKRPEFILLKKRKKVEEKVTENSCAEMFQQPIFYTQIANEFSEYRSKATFDFVDNLFWRAVDWKTTPKWNGLWNDEFYTSNKKDLSFNFSNALFLLTGQHKTKNDCDDIEKQVSQEYAPLTINDVFLLFNVGMVSRKWFYSTVLAAVEKTRSLHKLEMCAWAQIALLMLADSVYWSSFEFKHVRRCLTGPSVFKAWSSTMLYPHVSTKSTPVRPGILGVGTIDTITRYIQHRWSSKFWPERDDFASKIVTLINMDTDLDKECIEQFGKLAMENLNMSKLSVGLIVVHAMASKYGRPLTITKLLEKITTLKDKTETTAKLRLLVHILLAEMISGMFNFTTLSDVPSLQDLDIDDVFPFSDSAQEYEPLIKVALLVL